MTAQSIYYVHTKSESLYSRLLKTLFVVIRARKFLGKQLAKPDKIKNEAAPVPKSVRKKIRVKEEEFRGRTLWTLSPKKATSNKAIFYVHGGAYIFNMSSLLWNYLAKIVEKTGVSLTVANYPLAPQSDAGAAYTYLHKLYETFLSRSRGKEILFLGDSAGGGLAISFAQYLNEIDLPQPRQIILSSPWLDVSLTNPAIKDSIPDDKVLEIKGLQKAGKMFAGKLDTRDPKVSPIYGDFDSIGKLSIFMGTGEIFVPDSRKLVARLQKENIPFNYFEYPKMIHCWLLMGMPEAKVALNQMINIINE